MSCNLTSGRNEVCKSSIGGIKGLYLFNEEDINYITYLEIDGTRYVMDFNVAYIFYFPLKGNSNYVETITSSRDNGTTFYQQTLTLNLKHLDSHTTQQFKKIAYSNDLKGVVWTENGEAYLIGEVFGLDAITQTAQTGGALGDLIGYSTTIQGIEKNPAAYIYSSELSTTAGHPFGMLRDFQGTITIDPIDE